MPSEAIPLCPGHAVTLPSQGRERHGRRPGRDSGPSHQGAAGRRDGSLTTVAVQRGLESRPKVLSSPPSWDIDPSCSVGTSRVWFSRATRQARTRWGATADRVWALGLLRGVSMGSSPDCWFLAPASPCACIPKPGRLPGATRLRKSWQAAIPFCERVDPQAVKPWDAADQGDHENTRVRNRETNKAAAAWRGETASLSSDPFGFSPFRAVAITRYLCDNPVLAPSFSGRGCG